MLSSSRTSLRRVLPALHQRRDHGTEDARRRAYGGGSPNWGTMAEAAHIQRVWITGAGFSASLGAPLLNDLLSFRLRSRLISAGFLVSGQSEDAGPAKDEAYIQDLVYGLYHHGTGYGEGYLFEPSVMAPRGERGLWRHAEEYLERLDELAVTGGDAELHEIRGRFLSAIATHQGGEPGRDRLFTHLLKRQPGGALPTLSAKDFAREAKRIVAAECCHFLRSVTAKSERAKPYARWLRNIGTASRDTIVTFNYDCVLEHLGGALVRDVLVAGADGDIEQQQYRSKKLGSPLLIKLHGSVDWQRIPANGALPFRRSGDLEHAVKSPENQIATPGGSKLASSEGDLQALWALASKKIREAQEVIFIGYRIPESDAAAREMILDALQENENKQLRVKVVLGPPSFDRARLTTLLEVTMPERSRESGSLDVQAIDAWAQDYLQAWRG